MAWRMALIFTATAASMIFAAPDTVKVDGGLIAGTIDGNVDNVRVFKGIPFAAWPGRALCS